MAQQQPTGFVTLKNGQRMPTSEALALLDSGAIEEQGEQAGPRSQREILADLPSVGAFQNYGENTPTLGEMRTGLRRTARIAPLLTGLAGPLVQGPVSGLANLVDQILGLTEGEKFSGTELAAQTALGFAGGGLQRGFQMIGSGIRRGAVAIKGTIIKFSKEVEKNVARAFGVRPEEVEQVISRILVERKLHPNLLGDLQVETNIKGLATQLKDVLEETMNTLDPKHLQARARQIVLDGDIGTVGSPRSIARMENELADFMDTPSMSQIRKTTRVEPLPNVGGKPPRGTIFGPDDIIASRPTRTVTTSTRVPRESITAPVAQAQKLARRAVADFDYTPGVQTPQRETNLSIVRAIREGIETLDPRVGPLNREMGQEMIMKDILEGAGHRGRQGALVNIPEFMAVANVQPGMGAVAASGRPMIASRISHGVDRLATGFENIPGIPTRTALQLGEQPLEDALGQTLDEILSGLLLSPSSDASAVPGARRRALTP